ncbi:hypothetical protein QCA50_005600 [Cerrena zonata]|uniref:BTB domain-containing protein n=1 Tax=Cerrena zonata TaxID=2478898 RepID=A0AAW0GDJ0_9APHY
MLSECSDIFRDMFEVAQPNSSDSRFYDGSSVVHLSETMNEVVVFLQIIYSHGNHPYLGEIDKPAPMQWVSTLLKLGEKYQAKSMLDGAMRRLRLACPMSRDGFENAIIEYRGGGVAISILNLAHTHGLSRLLPVAYYLCCQLPINMLVNRVNLEDGTVVRLTSKDLTRCLRGRGTNYCKESHSTYITACGSPRCRFGMWNVCTKNDVSR